jgi:epoxyqueuosine reductase
LDAPSPDDDRGESAGEPSADPPPREGPPDVALDARVRARARSLGFVRVGVAEVEPLEPEAQALARWLAAGHHGEMSYMAETGEVRADVRHSGMLPSARSVVVVAASYRRSEENSALLPGRVARYALGRDYHHSLGKRMQRLAAVLRREGHAARAAVDLLPILERAWAQRAGLGFIGKNCMLIVPGLGSHLLLGSVVTSARLVPDAPMRERCGECRACLDACPTGAFLGERTLDARRCIAYLTIEQPGPIPEALRRAVGSWTFGCDACQDVCPFNRAKPLGEADTAHFVPDARLAAASLDDVLAADDTGFEALVGGTALSRPGRAGLARNAAVALGNVGTRKHLPVLTRAAERDPSEVVREAARWAAAEISRREP